MTNTIPNVPRELLERVLYLMDNYIGTTHPEEDEIRALLSAPSPAGVDGLNTDRNAAFKACPESGCDWGSFYLGWKARGEVEQAIIDGLRGDLLDASSVRNSVQRERDAYRLLLDRECNDADSMLMALGIEPDEIRTEGGFLMVAHLVSRISGQRDQLAGLLREVRGWIEQSAKVYRHNSTSVMLHLIDAALSAGKEGE